MSAVLLKVLWIYGLTAAVSMLIAGVIKLMVWLLNLAERKPVDAGRPTHAAAPVPVAHDPAAEHIAVIGAAVYACIGAHRIVHISDTRAGAGWRTEGRSAQHGSHAPQTRNPPH
jgi:hypothetical protein